MAQRRMFSPDIICSEEFLDMPVSARDLYCQLCIRADDDGFIQPRMTMRMVGASSDDLKVLLAKRFLLTFESGVVVVKHWLIHNMIRMDRYHPTRFQEEKKALQIKENKSYTELATNGLQNGNQMAPQVRLGKVRLGKVSNISSGVPDQSFLEFWNYYPRKEAKKKAEGIWKSKKLSASLPAILLFLEKAKVTERWRNPRFIPQPTTFLSQERWNDELDNYGILERTVSIR